MLRTQKVRKQKTESNRDLQLRHIILVDQEPLRQRVSADCSRAMARLERVRAGWHHFERKDKPAFARWRAREFGALLSTAREVETQIRDRQALIHEVEMEMRRGFQDGHAAYLRVMFRRENPSVASTEDGTDGSRERRGTTGKLSDFEKEALFQDWVKSSLGTSPDKLDDEVYAKTFEVFKSHMFRNPAEERPPDIARSGKKPFGSSREGAMPSGMADAATPVDTRIKELYRRLVRRLHPDLRADGSTAVSALWHEAQEAYAASDVARMEILLALSDIEANRSADQSLFQMHAVRAELERSIRALEKSLLEAEGEEAWDFARVGPNEDLRERIERQLKADLAGRKRRLDLLTMTIADWAQGPVANRIVRVTR